MKNIEKSSFILLLDWYVYRMIFLVDIIQPFEAYFFFTYDLVEIWYLGIFEDGD